MGSVAVVGPPWFLSESSRKSKITVDDHRLLVFSLWTEQKIHTSTSQKKRLVFTFFTSMTMCPAVLRFLVQTVAGKAVI